MRERTERRLLSALFMVAVLLAWFCWPLAIDWNHRTNNPSTLGWVLFGIWFPIAVVLVWVREALVREARRNRRR